MTTGNSQGGRNLNAVLLTLLLKILSFQQQIFKRNLQRSRKVDPYPGEKLIEFASNMGPDVRFSRQTFQSGYYENVQRLKWNYTRELRGNILTLT